MVRSQNFVINLERDVDKKAHMESTFAALDLPLSFFNAVDGRAMSPGFIEDQTRSSASLDLLGRLLTVGELGCALSHRGAIERVVEENLDFAMICEDDIDFSPEVPHILDALHSMHSMHSMPSNWDVLLLGHHGPESITADTNCSFWYRARINKTFTIRRPCERSYGTYCYCISQQGAKKILPLLERIVLPIDFYTGNPDLLNVFVVEKPVVLLAERFIANSNIESERRAAEGTATVGRSSGLRRAVRTVINAVGLLKLSQYGRKVAARVYKKMKPMVPYV